MEAAGRDIWLQTGKKPGELALYYLLKLKASVNLMQGHSGLPLSRSDGPDETCLQ